ncbi:MAG TPA: DUF2189 domain-containing protein [Allosphingosinicella sp.]|jgi:uncharacterized membrane protein|nr:DUF2189 domain-containing protein [Allosphingosinicella sp.]
MAISHAAPAAASLAQRPPVRQIAPADLRFALAEGWRDFKSMRGDLLFAGLIYPIVGLVAAVVSLGGALIPLFFPIAAGIALLGPLTAIGFYELARRREQGLESGWTHFLDVRKRKAFPDMLGIGAILIGLFALWVAVAGGLFVALWGKNVPDSLGAFLTRLFTTKEGWELIVAGNAIGALFAVAVLALSVVSLPLLVDRDGGVGHALRTSIAAFSANFGTMIRWGLIVAILLVLGSIPAFVGLAVVLPWLGYATWHLYTRLVDRGRV